MKNKSLLLLSTVFINSCAMNYNFSLEQSLNIDYMQTAIATDDAKIAIGQENFTLIGFDQRGLVVPGIKQPEMKQLRCPVIRIAGMGDVVKSPEHLKKMQAVSRYSKIYNLEILKTTSCN